MTLISAREWPVFELYEIREDAATRRVITPVRGTGIVRRVDLLDAQVRQDAVKRAVKITKANREYAKDPMLAAFAAAGLGILEVDEDRLLDYVSRYGLLGLGPARILKVFHNPNGGSDRVVVRRQAGRLRWWSISDEPGGTLVDLESPFDLEPGTPWDYGPKTAFDYRIGSDEWWANYLEPLDEIARAVGYLSATTGMLELALLDTFPDLGAGEAPAFRRAEPFGWRAVSALGALGIAVLEGELEGWGVCDYELCRSSFQRSKATQRFCKPYCRSSSHDREVRQQRNRAFELHEAGYSDEDIAASILSEFKRDVDAETVRGWIDAKSRAGSEARDG